MNFRRTQKRISVLAILLVPLALSACGMDGTAGTIGEVDGAEAADDAVKATGPGTYQFEKCIQPRHGQGTATYELGAGDSSTWSFSLCPGFTYNKVTVAIITSQSDMVTELTIYGPDTETAAGDPLQCNTVACSSRAHYEARSIQGGTEWHAVVVNSGNSTERFFLSFQAY